jgi:hypothetical protein
MEVPLEATNAARRDPDQGEIADGARRPSLSARGPAPSAVAVAEPRELAAELRDSERRWLRQAQARLDLQATSLLTADLQRRAELAYRLVVSGATRPPSRGTATADRRAPPSRGVAAAWQGARTRPLMQSRFWRTRGKPSPPGAARVRLPADAPTARIRRLRRSVGRHHRVSALVRNENHRDASCRTRAFLVFGGRLQPPEPGPRASSGGECVRPPFDCARRGSMSNRARRPTSRPQLPQPPYARRR